MIRINLQKNASPNLASETKISDEGLSYGEVVPIQWPVVIIRLAVILLPIIGLHYYSTDTVNKKKKILRSLNNEKVSLDRRIGKLSSEIESFKRYEEEKKRLEQQIQAIGVLSKSRLQGVVSIDTIQALLPERTWITNLTLTNDDGGGLITLGGYAYNDQEISDLIQGLEETVFFTSVALGGSTEERTDRGVLKRFQINFRVQNI